MAPDGSYRIQVGTQEVQVPLVEVTEGLSIALLITVDQGVAFAERAGAELAERLAPFGAEVVVSVATMGIPLAIEVTRALGLDDYLILHKTPKIHLGDSIVQPVQSITTGALQSLRMDPARAHVVRGRRVAVVDDVVSTGASLQAALALLRQVGAEPVVVGTLVTEGAGWRNLLGRDADLVQALGSIPVFRHRADGGVVEEWGEEDAPSAASAAGPPSAPSGADA